MKEYETLEQEIDEKNRAYLTRRLTDAHLDGKISAETWLETTRLLTLGNDELRKEFSELNACMGRK